MEELYNQIGKMYMDLVKGSNYITQLESKLNQLQAEKNALEERIKVFENAKIMEIKGQVKED